MSIRFGPFTLDLDRRQLMQERREVHLTPKAFELLAILVSERPKAISKAVLQQHLWPDTFVAEANLSNLVAELRRAVDDLRQNPSWIRTAHGFGYAFREDDVTESRRPAVTDRPRCWLEWGGRRFRLSAGEHVIGRDPDVEIRLDASTVSRRHGRIVVAADGAWLEDFNSKNGTLHGAQRVTTPVLLVDGDIVHIGSLRLTFHVLTSMMSTDTQVDSTS